MINSFPDSSLVPRAKQKLRNVQEVLGERETEIGLYYESRENFVAAIARLQTVVDTYPLYSKSDLALLSIGDAYEGEAHAIQLVANLPGAIKERMRAVYQDRAAAAYSKVITRYPMAPHVEDARDRLVAMNRAVPEPTQEAVAENDAEERSRQPLRFTNKTFGLITHTPQVVEAVHVGEPSLDDPKRTIAPDITKQNLAVFNEALNAGKPAAAPAAAAQPTGPNEPPRSDQPSTAPLQLEKPEGGSGVGVQIVSAPSAPAATDPNAVIKPIVPVNNVLPAIEKPADAPDQVNEIKSGSTPAQSATDAKKKKPKADLSDESSSKKKKKKGLSKLNPF
jgi:outer membrane protein assembly factor BamD